MRIIFALLAALSLAACATTPRQWEKIGVDQDTARRDLVECRHAGAAESGRALPPDYAALRAGYYGRTDYFFARQRLDSERSYNAGRLANFCMRNKGYELNLVPTDIRPVTSLPRSP